MALTTAPRSGSGTSGDRALQHGLVLDERAFHLERANAVARALDHVIRPADEPEVAVFVTPGNVAGVVEPVMPRPPCQLGVFVVPVEHSRGQVCLRAHHDLSPFPDVARRAFVIHQLDLVTRGRHAHGARLGRHPGIDRHGHRHLRLAVPFHELDARSVSRKRSYTSGFSGSPATVQ